MDTAHPTYKDVDAWVAGGGGAYARRAGWRAVARLCPQLLHLTVSDEHTQALLDQFEASAKGVYAYGTVYNHRLQAQRLLKTFLRDEAATPAEPAAEPQRDLTGEQLPTFGMFGAWVCSPDRKREAATRPNDTSAWRALLLLAPQAPPLPMTEQHMTELLEGFNSAVAQQRYAPKTRDAYRSRMHDLMRRYVQQQLGVATVPGAARSRKRCTRCGRMMAVNKDGTLYRHRSGTRWCE